MYRIDDSVRDRLENEAFEEGFSISSLPTTCDVLTRVERTIKPCGAPAAVIRQGIAFCEPCSKLYCQDSLTPPQRRWR
jgi:hypothetical protein